MIRSVVSKKISHNVARRVDAIGDRPTAFPRTRAGHIEGGDGTAGRAHKAVERKARVVVKPAIVPAVLIALATVPVPAPEAANVVITPAEVRTKPLTTLLPLMEYPVIVPAVLIPPTNVP